MGRSAETDMNRQVEARKMEQSLSETGPTNPPLSQKGMDHVVSHLKRSAFQRLSASVEIDLMSSFLR